MIGNKVRDLVCVDIDKEKIMVIACDSSGGIGDKEHDALKVEPFITGKYSVRVGLLEILCSGAKVISIVDNVCAEMEPTGREIIKGIKSEMKLASIDGIPLTGSTEENFKVTSTGVGITVIGICEKKSAKINNISEKATVYAIGKPKVGSEINFYGDDEIFSYEDLNNLINLEEVLEIVPVGSKGILYEAKELAVSNKRKFELKDNVDLNLKKTCGPATVAIVAIKEHKTDVIKKLKNAVEIGKII